MGIAVSPVTNNLPLPLRLNAIILGLDSESIKKGNLPAGLHPLGSNSLLRLFNVLLFIPEPPICPVYESPKSELLTLYSLDTFVQVNFAARPTQLHSTGQ